GRAERRTPRQRMRSAARGSFFLPSAWSPVSPSLQDIADTFGDLTGMRFQREMAHVEDADHSPRTIALERLGAGREKQRIILAPGGQKQRLMLAEILLECRIQRHVALVVAEQIELDFISARTSQIIIVEVLTVRRDDRRVGHTVCVLPSCRLRSEEGA